MHNVKLDEWIRQRNIPALWPDGVPMEAGGHRQRWMDALATGEYGRMPPSPAGIEVREEKRILTAFGGKAEHHVYHLTCPTPGGRFSFPFHLVLPEGTDPAPVFVQISFFGDLPNPSNPVTNIVDRGFGVASVLYTDIAPDRPDGLDEKLAGKFGAAHRGQDGSGTIGYWAWAARRIVDFLTTHPRVDASRIAVIGHSRLGKTALWAGATDERIALTVSVQSGCSGAAITREKVGERVENISRTFPHWFCPKYGSYAGQEAEMPFEQHFLLAAIAPRLLYVCSAEEDQWADPVSEFLACVAASDAWGVEGKGKSGFLTPDVLPTAKTVLQEGRIGYHLRAGGHALEPIDWKHVMDFWALHRK